MSRPAPWRSDPACYPHRETIQTRFQDMDVLGHLNNVAYAALFETGRTKFNHAVGLFAGLGRRALVARVDIHYLAEGHYPDDVEIATGIGAIGGRSWQFLSAMMQRGRCIAICDVTLVIERGEDEGGMPDLFRARLEALRVTDPTTSGGLGGGSD